MKSMVNIPSGLTHGDDLVVIRRDDYEVLQRKISEFKDAIAKIKRGEMEFKNGKTKILSSQRKLG